MPSEVDLLLTATKVCGRKGRHAGARVAHLAWFRPPSVPPACCHWRCRSTILAGVCTAHAYSKRVATCARSDGELDACTDAIPTGMAIVHEHGNLRKGTKSIELRAGMCNTAH
eukprot:8252878-Pyramimonas_sp.AAC.1